MSQEQPGKSQEGDFDKETFNALREKMAVARGFDINQSDIDLAAKFLVNEAAARGEPYTTQEIERFGPEMQGRVLEALLKRVEARGASYAVVNSRGEVVGTARSLEKAKERTKAAAGEEERPELDPIEGK